MKKIIILIMCISIMTGCTCDNLYMNISSGGVVKYQNDILTDKETYESIKDVLKIEVERFTENGYSVEYINEDDLYGYRITKKLGTLDKLSKSSVKSNYLDGGNKGLFKKNNYILTKKYTSSFYIDSEDIDALSNIYNLFNDKEDEITNDMTNTISENITFKFILDSKLLVKNANNDSVENDKYIWNINSSNDNIYFEIYEINYGLLFMICLIILIIIYYSILMTKKNSRDYKISKVTVRDSLNMERKVYEKQNKKGNNRFH